MNDYKMVIYGIESNEGIQYVAEYPALKGVSGVGMNPSEAIIDLKVNAEVNLAALREAQLPIPESDFLIQTQFSGKLSLRLSKGLHAQLARFAEAEGISINQCIVEAVAQYVSRKNADNSKHRVSRNGLFISE